jgi:hypothetical protein
VFVLPGLLRQLAEALERRGQAVTRLGLRIVQESGPAARLQVRSGRPTRHVPTLERLVRRRLEGLRLSSPALELQLEAEEAVPEVAWQPGLLDRTQASEPLEELVARLSDALGPESLFTSELVEDWCPERAWRPVPAERGAVRPARARPRRADPVARLAAWEDSLPLPRPTWLLPRPEPLEVRTEAQRPVALRRDRGWELVEQAEGPEHLSGAWWSAREAFERVYWVVRVPQGTGWIFTDRGRWFLHGWFD